LFSLDVKPPVRLTAVFVGFILSSCAIPITRSDSFIVVANQIGRPRCVGVARAIRHIASDAGYAEIAVPPSADSRLRILAIYGRRDQRIILYDWDGSCVVHADELQHVLRMLRSRGYHTHVEVKTYPGIFELIPYAP